jgi:sec-independent protein translocase protein TatA
MKLGIPEIIVILILVAVLFGTNKMPQVAKSIGNAIGAFRNGMSKAQKGEELFTEEDGEKLKETAGEAVGSMKDNAAAAAQSAVHNVSSAVNVAKEKAEERIEAVKELYNDSDASKADAAEADAAGDGSPDKQA